MTLIDKALEIALSAHQGQTDRAGEPYIKHPLRLYSKMDTDKQRAVALLHDVVEDSDYTYKDLEELFPEDVAVAVACLTKNEGETYKEYIRKIAEKPIARKVKLADLEDNLNLLRLEEVSEADIKRSVKYHWAYKTLQKADRK